MMPCVSAGSNQVGARVTWMPQVSWPCGPPARPAPPATIVTTTAATVSNNRDGTSLPRNNGRTLNPGCGDLPVMLASSGAFAAPLLVCAVRQAQVLIGCRIGVAGDESQTRLLDPRP